MPTDTVLSSLRIALVYDWVTTTHGGAEWVLQTLLEAFPTAPLFTSVSTPVDWVHHSRVLPSWLQKLPGHSHHRLLAPLIPLAIESLDVSAYDIVLSISSGMSLGVLTKPEQLHFTYLLAPPRYVYEFDTYYHNKRTIRDTAVKLVSAPARAYLGWWQQSAIFRPDVIVPLSSKVKLQAESVYTRDIAAPLTPPVRDLSRYVNPQLASQLKLTPFWLSLSRQVAYKRVDLTIAAARASQQSLLCIGSGPETSYLQKCAGAAGIQINSIAHWQSVLRQSPGSIGFWQAADTAGVATALASATMVIALGADDFGLVPLEAAILGTPSLYDHSAGVAEVLKPGVEGIPVTEMELPSIIAAAQAAGAIKLSLAHQRFLAKTYSSHTFIHSLETQLTQAWYTLMQQKQ